jgi:hypothetical protein
MRNLNPKIVLILDEERVVFMCKICGKVWSPKILKDGRLSRGSWQCTKWKFLLWNSWAITRE